MAAVLELMLQEEVTVAEVFLWLTNRTQDHPVNSSLASLSLLRKDFVPFLLNFLREQTCEILSNAPSTPSKTPNSKAVSKSSSDGTQKPVSERSSADRSGHRGSRVQLFAQTPNSSHASDTCFTSANSSDSSFLSKSNLTNWSGRSITQTSPNFNSSPTTHYNKRSTHKPSLGNFLILTPEMQTPRRGRKKNSTGRQAFKDQGRRTNDEEFQRQDIGGKNGCMNIISSPTHPSELNVNNLEEFPPMSAQSQSASKSKPSRRINPTPISDVQSQSKSRICFTSTPINESHISRQIGMEVFTNVQEGSCTPAYAESLREEREILKKERIKLLQQTSAPVSLDPVTPTKQSYSRNTIVPVDNLVAVDVDKVSNKKQLAMLAELFSACITGNLVPNIFLEFFFVLQLLTTRGSTSMTDEEHDLVMTKDAVERQYFQSVHNCVFFAVEVLDSQFAIISYLDKSILKLLAENDRVAAFSSSLQERLLKAYETSKAKVSLLLQTTIQSVSFQPETDNRSNFPNDHSFHIFKKQRDIFYELLREWEDNHIKTNWAFESCLGMKIRAMIFHLTVTCNHSHFARLFQKQLIQMCKEPNGGMGGASIGDTPDQDVLNMLGSDNLNKLKRLQERFVARQTVSGPCPPPSFPGYQEFFRDFILSAGSYQFNQHLMDSLCQEIQELDGVSIVGHEPADGESDMDQQGEKVRFASILLTLRLLAKFLGFLTFLPYRTTEFLTSELQESAVALRNRTLPMLDVLQLLRRSFQNHRTVLTVPWVVEYLSLVDCVAPLLDYYQKVFSLLLHLYRYKLILTEENDMGFLNKLLILAVLGWLFQVPPVPDELFFNNETVWDDIPINTVVVMQGLDSVPLVDQQLLYSCCPYLGELRKLLTSFVAGCGAKNGGFIRKITPTAAEPLMPKPTLTQKKLQAELEQAFFHNQLPSLRRTVEFVAERIGSNCVKHIKATLVADLVKRAEVILKDKVTEDSSSHAKLLEDVWTELCRDGRQSVHIGKEYCKKKVPEAVKVLLPEEISIWVLRSAEEIALTLAIEKACTWLNSNISALIKREVKAAFSCMVKSHNMTSISKDVKMDCVEGCKHQVSMPSKILNDFKDILCVSVGPHEKGEHVAYQHLKNLFSRLSETLGCRKYLYPLAEQHLAKYSVELACLLVSDQIPVLGFPESPADGTHNKKEGICELLTVLLSLWEKDFRVAVPVQLLFSQRNSGFVANIQAHTWGMFVFLLRGIVHRGLMKAEDVVRHMRNLPEYKCTLDFLVELEAACVDYTPENGNDDEEEDATCKLVPQTIARVTAQS